MAWQVVKPLRPHPLSVGQARNFCTRRLHSVLDFRSAPDETADYDELVFDAAAIASELVTNAVVAGSSSIELFLGLSKSAIRIEVSDDADGLVVPATPTPDDTAGRGLVVVAALSSDWGVTAEEGGKHVWAELSLPEQGGDHPA